MQSPTVSPPFDRFIEGMKQITPARKAAVGAMIFRLYGYMPYHVLAEVFAADPVACTLLNAYTLDEAATGVERINRFRGLEQLEHAVFAA